MKTAVDKAGRVVIPKVLRDKAALSPGTEVEVRYERGRIVLEPSEGRLRLVKRGRFYVAVSEDSLPKLTTDEVEEIRRTLRRDRTGFDES